MKLGQIHIYNINIQGPKDSLLSVIIDELKVVTGVDSLEEIIHIEDVIEFESDTPVADQIERTNQLVICLISLNEFLIYFSRKWKAK